jgi:acetyl/propionyl-CoA carboxylase alpha subunit
MPGGPGVRIDAGIEAGDRVPPEYDNLVAKLLVHAGDRDAAIARLARALDEVEVTGIQTTLPFHRFVARHPAFRHADLSTEWVGEHWDGEAERRAAAGAALLAAGLASEDHSSGGRPVPSLRKDEPRGPGGWDRSALEAAVDRWPR